MTLPSSEYRPPPERVCVAERISIPLDDHGQHLMSVFQLVYRGKIVHFSIEQRTRDSWSGKWTTVVRIDTSHGVVHRHLLDRKSGKDRKTVYEVIPQEGWKTVDNWFGRAYDEILNHWEDRIRRWET